MKRERVVTASMIVLLLGAIITTVGMMIASGVDQGGTAYKALSTASMFFWLFSVVMIVFLPENSKDEQNQSQPESDSSLL